MIEEQEKTLQDYMAILSRRKIPMLVTMLIVFLIGIVVAMVWPPTYKSSATILIKEQEIPSELVMSTVTSFASQRIQMISQRVMTRSNLMQVIEKYKLYIDDRRRYTTEEVLEAMRESIGLEMISADVMDPRTGRPGLATIAFTLSFEGEAPGSTQKVAGELTSLFLAENLKNRKEKASETFIFLTDESNKLAETISQNEKKIAEFKEMHADSLPEVALLNLSTIDRLERELESLSTLYGSKQERIVFLETQLAQINPLANMHSSTGQMILDPVSRLKALESEYASASVRYSSEHPDVIKLKREIDGLKSQAGYSASVQDKAKTLTALRSEYGSMKKKYSATHPDVMKLKKSIASLEKEIADFEALPETKVLKDNPDNPAYISIQGQLQVAKSELSSYREKENSITSKLAIYHDRADRSPQVERDFLSLTRNLTNTLIRYREIKAKQMAAEIGHELEKESKGESFVLIEPAQLPEKPVSPNRPAILFLSFIFALACAFGLAILKEAMDVSVRGIAGIKKLLTTAPLAVIPVIYITQDYYRRKRMRRIFVSSAIISIVVVVMAVHFFVTPLDVLWFRSIRKAENIIGID